jgi:hypothetical protein
VRTRGAADSGFPLKKGLAALDFALKGDIIDPYAVTSGGACMRKLLTVLLVALLPAIAFADFQIGGVGMYTSDISTIQTTSIGITDFTFGAETRLKLGLFQGGASLLYYPSASYSSIVALTDIGISLDVAILRLGFGLGPNLAVNLGSAAATPTNVGLNLKLSTDVNLGSLSIGLVGFYYLKDFSDLSSIGSVFSKLPWLGVTAMVKLL